MTLYAESSAVLRWLFEEAGGDEVHRLLRDATKVVCSRLTLVETRRAIRRAVAEKLLDEVSSTAVLEVFAQAGAGWAILELSREVAERGGIVSRGARPNAGRAAPRQRPAPATGAA